MEYFPLRTVPFISDLKEKKHLKGKKMDYRFRNSLLVRKFLSQNGGHALCLGLHIKLVTRGAEPTILTGMLLMNLTSPDDSKLMSYPL